MLALGTQPPLPFLLGAGGSSGCRDTHSSLRVVRFEGPTLVSQCLRQMRDSIHLILEFGVGKRVVAARLSPILQSGFGQQ